MKVKAKDVAARLGISTATVSLAMNNKPGVSEKTKQKILDCIESMKNGENFAVSPQGNIMVIVAKKDMNVINELDVEIWSDFITTFERETKRLGYGLSVTYYDVLRDNAFELIQKCNQEMAGVLLYAFEIDKQDFKPFKRLKVPVVISDNNFDDNNYNYIAINNRLASKMLVELLVSQGKRDILYAAHSDAIYNFLQRRAGFDEAILEHKEKGVQGETLILGNKIEDIFDRMVTYLKKHNKLPDAILMENYQVSIGVIKALRVMNINTPKQIAIAGIDELPSYMIMDMELTTININHGIRAKLAAECLADEIAGLGSYKYTILVAPELYEGGTVR